MKNLLKTIAAVIVCIATTSGLTAQTYKSDEENKAGGSEVIVQGQHVAPEFLANLGIISAPNPKNSTIEGNSVFVRQIGDFNTADIQTRTNASEINLLQNGNYNDTRLDYSANTAVADLIQNGDNNRIRDFVNNPGADVSLDLIQDGNNLNFERDGVNELTKSLKFRQTEASPTIIVRSFN